MGEDGEVSRYLDLSREYLAAAKLAAAHGSPAPARFNSTHALELAVKAAIAASTGEAPKVHNVGGEFGRRFRERVGSTTLRRVNRLLDDYNASRYPDWEAPSPERLAEDIMFIEEFITRHVPRLIKEATK